MIGKSLIKKLVAGFAAAGAAFVAVVALGAAVFYALLLVLPALGAAALTFALFAAVAALIALVFLKDGGMMHDDDDDDDGEPEGLAARAVHLLRDRPIIGAGVGLGALFFLIRNPALAAIVASMVTEKRMESKGYGRRRR